MLRIAMHWKLNLHTVEQPVAKNMLQNKGFVDVIHTPDWDTCID